LQLDINLLGDNTCITKGKNTQKLVANAETSKYVFTSRHQSAGQNLNIATYLGATATNQNYFPKKLRTEKFLGSPATNQFRYISVPYLKPRMMRWPDRVARVGEMRNVYKTFVGKPQQKRPLGSRSKDNNKTNLMEKECEVVDWIHLAQDSAQLRALVNTVMNLRVP
jgi:hypothetical protein